MSIQNYINLMEQNKSSMQAQLKQFSLQPTANFQSLEGGDISSLMSNAMNAHLQGAIQNVNALSAVENTFKQSSAFSHSSSDDGVIEGESVVVNEEPSGG